MKSIMLFTLICCHLMSCTSSKAVLDDEQKDAFNAAAYGKTCEIRFAGLPAIWGRETNVSGKSVTCTNKAGKLFRFNLDSVKTISFVINRGNAGLKAAGIVFGVCVMIGLVNESKSGDGQFVSPAEVGFAAGLGLSPVGFLIGYMSGERVQYTFH